MAVSADARLDAAVKTNDGFFTTFFVSPWSKHAARWCARRAITPDQVTVFSFALGIGAAVLFATGQRWAFVAGGLIAYFAFFTDCVDGQLARYTQRFSAIGAWLDAILDRGKEYAILAGLAAGARPHAWVLAGAAITLQTARHALVLNYVAQHGWRMNVEGQWLRRVLVFPIGERFAVIALVTAVFDARTTLVVWLICAGVASAYMVAGRVARMIRASASSAQERLGAQRDDGPLRLPGGFAPVPLLLAAVAAIVAGILADWPPAPVVSAAVVLGTLTSGAVPADRFRTLVPALLRAVEFTAIAWTTDRAGHPAAGYALLAVIAFRHYDLIYRPRPADAVALLGLGWGGRVLLVLALASSAPALFALAGVLAVLWVGDAARHWTGVAA